MPARFLINGRPTIEWTQSDMARVRLGRREPVCEAVLLSPDDAIRRAIKRIRQFYIVFGGGLALVFLILAMVGRGQPGASFVHAMLGVAALVIACLLPFLYPYQAGKARQRIAQSPLPGPAGSTMRADDSGLAIEGHGLLPWSSLAIATADMLRIPVRDGESYFLVKSLLLTAASGSDSILLDPSLFTGGRAFIDNVFQRLQAGDKS
jgi:hypothetical protein